MITLRHCPGFETYKHLKSFSCKCPECGKEREVFSDEMERKHICKGCGKKISFDKCQLDGSS